jgi:carbonic anhydrase
MAAEETLAKLLEGNQRFIKGVMHHPRQDPRHRQKVSAAQAPLAVVVGCSDSRTSPEIIFDAGLGDLFVVRSAGCSIDRIGIESVALPLQLFRIPLIIVLGHEKCGAIQTAMSPPADNFVFLRESLRPAIETSAHLPGDSEENACVMQVYRTIQSLTTSPILSPLLTEIKSSIVGAFYQMQSGIVDILPASKY